jgi:hypothetical protein
LRPSARFYALEIFAELNDEAPTSFKLNTARIETVCVGSDGGWRFVTDASR